MRLATENRSWGPSRILGELKKLKIRIGRTTLADILERNGIPPSPKRQQEVRCRERLGGLLKHYYRAAG